MRGNWIWDFGRGMENFLQRKERSKNSGPRRETLKMDGANNNHGVMGFLEQCKGILKIQKFRRMVSYTGFYCFATLITYAYTSNTTRAGMSRSDQFYASYPAGTELLTDTAKLYKAALGNCFEEEDWGPIEYSIMAKHFERQGKPPYAYHAQYMAHILSHGQLEDGSS